MILFKSIQTHIGQRVNFIAEYDEDIEVDASHLLLLPALIDPHVHFRVPGGEHKEDWRSGAKSALHGGVTTVFDMPNNQPACTTYERLMAKKQLIDLQLKEAGIPLNYRLYIGADKNCLGELPKVKNEVVGIKVFMGSSTGELLIDDDLVLEEIFKIAAYEGMIVAIHGECEEILLEKKRELKASLESPQVHPRIHSTLRDRSAAIQAVKKALDLAEKYGTTLYILHMSTKEELGLVQKAKKQGVSVYAEACPHHLFLSEGDYEMYGTRVQMNPPLRTIEDQVALWQGLNSGLIDTIGTDHAPHTVEEKERGYGQAPSGIPGVQTLLPLLLDAVNRQRISMEKLVSLTRFNCEKIFRLQGNDDYVVVDPGLNREVDEKKLFSKCGWSPYHGRRLQGWPQFTVLKGQAYRLGIGERF